MRLPVSAIHHHEPLSLPKNVEEDMISPSERAITQVRMKLHLHPKF